MYRNQFSVRLENIGNICTSLTKKKNIIKLIKYSQSFCIILIVSDMSVDEFQEYFSDMSVVEFQNTFQKYFFFHSELNRSENYFSIVNCKRVQNDYYCAYFYC